MPGLLGFILAATVEHWHYHCSLLSLPYSGMYYHQDYSRTPVPSAVLCGVTEPLEIHGSHIAKWRPWQMGDIDSGSPFAEPHQATISVSRYCHLYWYVRFPPPRSSIWKWNTCMLFFQSPLLPSLRTRGMNWVSFL